MSDTEDRSRGETPDDTAGERAPTTDVPEMAAYDDRITAGVADAWRPDDQTDDHGRRLADD